MTTLNPAISETLEQIDRKIAARSILNHPFYRAWQAGTLTREQLAGYAAEYYPHVAAFPGYLATAIAGSRDVSVRAELAENLREELSVPAPHPALWLNFAGAMGGDVGAVSAATPTAATDRTVREFHALAGASTGEALAALYAYESQQPKVAAEKARGLVERYGIDDEKALAYFEVHAEADIRHSEGERAAIARTLESGESTPEQVLAATDRALNAYWNLLDGICASTGVQHAC